MDKNTIHALELILKEEYDKYNAYLSLQQLIPKEKMITARPGKTIIYQHDPATQLYFLLTGRVKIVNQIEWASDSIIDYVSPPHILGMVEKLTNVDNYTAYVVADTNCVLFRMPTTEFMNLIQQNNELCYLTLIVMGKIANKNMDWAEQHRVFPPKDILGHFLYLKAKQHLPYTYPFTRTKLSEELNINLRTLYRYINHLEKEGYLALRHGKIIIEEEHWNKLSDRYKDIIL